MNHPLVWIGVAVILIPIVIYYSVSFGTVAFFRARYLVERDEVISNGEDSTAKNKEEKGGRFGKENSREEPKRV